MMNKRALESHERNISEIHTPRNDREKRLHAVNEMLINVFLIGTTKKKSYSI